MRTLNAVLGMVALACATVFDMLAYVTAESLFNAASGVCVIVAFGYFLLTILGNYDEQSKR